MVGVIGAGVDEPLGMVEEECSLDAVKAEEGGMDRRM